MSREMYSNLLGVALQFVTVRNNGVLDEAVLAVLASLTISDVNHVFCIWTIDETKGHTDSKQIPVYFFTKRKQA